MNLNKPKIVLIAIIILAAFLRFYRLGEVPMGITWDEAAVGYNAWSIVSNGKDEWNNSYPLVFKSFEDDKSPIHIYITAASVFIFGLNDFSIRLPMAIFGVFNVLLIYFLVKEIYSKNIGYMAAFLMAISPYSIQFSKFNHESGISLAFFMVGLIYLIRFIKKKTSRLYLVSIFFGLSALTYHTALVFIPLITVVCAILFYKDLFINKIQLFFSICVVLVFLLVCFFEPGLLGINRLNQTSLSDQMIKETYIYESTQNLFLGRIELYVQRYLSHFTYQYLFKSGDPNPKFSSQYTGQFYLIEGLLLVAGALSFVRNKSRFNLLILSWALLAPIPASITGGASEAPHAARSMFVMGSWQIIGSLGFFSILGLIRSINMRKIYSVTILIILFLSTFLYLKSYYLEYAPKYAFEWIYGMKQSVEYIQKHQEYEKVYITDNRAQPYIFYLFYLKYPQPEFMKERVLNTSNSKSYNLVTSFGKYHFGDWDPIESEPIFGVLYIVSPSQYDGLRHKSKFNLQKPIKNPDGTVAFYIVSLY